MKKVYSLWNRPAANAGSALVMLLLALLACVPSRAQVASPCDANPFCSDSSYVFPNTSGNVITAPGPPVNYACVSTQPNPVWYWMQIGVSGTIQLTVNQTNTSGVGTDVDFAMWGPFTDLPAGCAAILAGAAPIQCSYDGGGVTEVIGLGLPGGSGVGSTGIPGPPGGSTPPAAVVGEVYIVMLTNFANTPGTISFSQTAGTGSADCGIVCGLSADNNGPKCVGEQVTISAINSDTANTFTYYWSGPNGYAAGTKNATFNPVAPGSYTFEVIAVSTDNDTCRATTEVLVHPLPSVAFTNSNNRILCNIDSTTIAISAPTANATYQWYRNDTAINGATGTQITTGVDGIYTVVGISDQGCSDTSAPITVLLRFTDVDFDFTIGLGCTEDTVHFNNLSEAGVYWWQFGDGTHDTITHPTHIYQDQNSYMVTLTVTDLDGCIDSVSKTVNVVHPLVAQFSSSVDSVCQTSGTPVQFTDASVGAITGWQWDFADGAVSTQQSPVHTFSLAGNREVRLVINDAIPCYDTVYHTIYVDSLPFIQVVQDKHVICKGDVVNFSTNYLYTLNQLSWDFGDGSHWTEKGNTSHSYDQVGTHPITVFADFPVCADITLTDSIVVNDYPQVYLGPDSVLCLDGPAITVTDQHNAGNPAVSWLWNTGATTASIEIVHPGTYSVTATSNDCSTTEQITVNKDCYTDIPNAFTPNGDGQNDYFYPRQLLSKGVTAFTMSVFNRWGQKVFETSNPNGRGWDGRFNEKDQPVGVYLYQIHVVMKNGRVEDYTGNVTLIR